MSNYLGSIKQGSQVAVMAMLMGAAWPSFSGDMHDKSSADGANHRMEQKSDRMHASDNRSRYENATAEVKDAWLDGKLETAFLLNRHLNNFDIQTDVEDGEVTLRGSVASDIERDLAKEIAMSVDGVESVDNRLEVKDDDDDNGMSRDYDNDEGRELTFSERVNDATLTAEIKIRLLANNNTSGLDIDVDTRDTEVTLTGEVGSDQEKELAATIAGNVDGVSGVDNRLRARK